MELQELLNRLDGVRSMGAGRYQCKCPAHSDKKPSLTITDTPEKILIHCHAGCKTHMIMDALGLKITDLFKGERAPETWQEKMEKSKGEPITGIYHYTDESGKYLYTKFRTPNVKGCYGIINDDGTYFKYGLNGVDKTLYNLPDIARAIKEGKPIYFVEGEKDVHTLKALELPATTCGGAKEWKKRFADVFTGATVVILPDNDEAGRGLNNQVTADLIGVAKKVVSVPTSTAEKGDVTDYLEEGHTKEELLKLVSDALKPSSSTVCLADVEPTETEWLWYPYIPLGKITLLQSDPGMGKTQVGLHIVTNVTTGRSFFNDNPFLPPKEPANAIYQTAEDGIADTIVPRLAKMNPDFNRIFFIKEDNTQLTFKDSRIEEALKMHNPRLMIFDPLQAFLGANVDMHRANEVRPVLAHVAELAEKYNCAILIIMHMSKMTQNSALHRGLGSIDIPALARSVLVIGSNPADPEEKILAHVKSSLAPHGDSLAWRYDGEKGVVFTGISDLQADDILNPARTRKEKNVTKSEAAADFLLGVLEPKGYELRSVIETKAEAAGIAKSTLYNAKKTMGIQNCSVGFSPKKTWWFMPDLTKDDLPIDGEQTHIS